MKAEVLWLMRDSEIDEATRGDARSPLDRLLWLTEFVTNSGASGAAVKVACVLARHVNSQSGRCDPSSETIARWSGVTNPRRAIRELRERGLIRVFEREGKSNEYALLFPEDQPVGRVTTVQGNQGGGQIGHTTPDNCDTPPRTNRSPKQGKEQGKEQEGPDGPNSSDRYAFNGSVIRLTSEHLQQWHKSYSAIPDLRAVLQSRDDWLASDDPKAIKARPNWFVSTSNYLAGKNQAALKAAKNRPSLPMLTEAERQARDEKL